MKEEILTLPEAVPYGLSGRPFSLPNDMKIWGRSVVRSGRGVRLEYPERTPSAIANGQRLAKEIQQSLCSAEVGNLEDEMRSLRGRSWSL